MTSSYLEHWLSRAATLALAVGTLLWIPPAASPQAQRDLRARAQANGTVRVIATVRAPFQPEGGLAAPGAALSQRQGISRAQNRVLARLASYGATSLKRFESIPYLAMEVDGSALTALLSDPDVASVQEDVPVPALELAPGGDVAPPQSLAGSTAHIGADRAWSSGYSGAGRIVAILDTGVEKSHSFLSGKVVSEACYSTNDASFGSSSLCPGGGEVSTASGSGVSCSPTVSGCDHGTHVAGIAAGKGSSFSGVARDARIVAVQVFSRFDNPGFCGSSSPCVLSWTSDQIQGLERVLALRSSYDIAAVNMSLGGGRYFSTASCDSSNAAIKAAIDNLRSVGIATVIASGNNGYDDSMSAPGCVSSAVSVGSSNLSDGISFFSNEAPFLSLYAPGEAIRSSVPFNAFATKSGTSMATPHVAGAWAVVKQRVPAASVAQALSTLKKTGVPLTSTSGGFSTPRIRLDLAVGAATEPWLSVDAPEPDAVVQAPFQVAGWSIDAAAVSGSGVDAVHVTAVPAAGGAPVFLGAASLGISRPDVGALFGSQFDRSGYALSVTTSLPTGSYTLQISARSVITGTFDIVRTRHIQVPGPLMAVDTPGPGAVLPWPIRVSGWAVHTAAASGTGVDAVHVWAFPAGGGTATFLGAATLGVSRPDVASFLGGTRFASSGFQLDSSALLPTGSYTLQIYARSTPSGAFDNFVNRAVTVRGHTRASLDAPQPNAFLTVPFTVSGWAFDTGSPGSVGVDAVHVWALPPGSSTGTFLGAATLGGSRPDVASFFNQAAFEPSGYRLSSASSLADGSYTLEIRVRSASTGVFETAIAAPIHVGSAPRMNLDAPGPGATLSPPFAVAGWALDLTASSGTGVDFVHVWAFPLDGSKATFLGSATLGGSRPDVGSFFGSSRFDGSGFRLDVTAPLPSGSYHLAVYARSTVTGTFNNSRSVVLYVP